MGYEKVPDNYFPTIAAWVKNIHGWTVSTEEIRYIPGICKGIWMAVECFLAKDYV